MKFKSESIGNKEWSPCNPCQLMYSTYWTPFYRCQEAYYKHSQIETLEILCYTTKVNAMSQEDNETEQYKIMNRLSRQEQIRIFRYLLPTAFVLSLLLYGIFGSKVIWNAVLYLAIATFILRMIRMWLEFKVEKKIKKKEECNLV